MANGPRETLFGIKESDDVTQQGIADFLAKFMSPEIANFLSTVIKGSIGDVFNNTLSGGQSFGPGALFGGQRDVGVDLWNSFNQRAMDLAMTGTERALQQTLHDQKVTMHQFWGAKPGDAEKFASEFSVSNMMVSMMAQLRQPRELQAGMQIGAAYMGNRTLAGLSVESAEIQQRINDQVRALSTGVFKDVNDPLNMNKYSGMGGRDLGRIYAELSRTGGIQPNFTVPQATDVLAQSAAAVSAGGRFFQGGVIDVIDQTNMLLGVNAFNTFGGEGTADMFRQMTATGYATGLRSPQMLRLAQMSGQYAMNIGAYDPSGAMSMASETAILYRGALAQGGRFVNEGTLRQGIMRNVVQAQESPMAKLVAGAYATIRPEDRQDFIEQMRGANITTLAEAGNFARQFGATGNDLNFLNIAETYDARVFRSREGIGTTIATAAGARKIDRFRRNRMIQLGEGDVAAGIKGFITEESLAEAYADDPNMLGILTKNFETAARARNTTLANEDAFLISTETTGVMRPLREHIEARMKADKSLSLLGKTSGLMGLYGMFSLTAKEGGKPRVRDAWDAIFGRVNLEGTTREALSRQGREFLDEIEDPELLAGFDVMFRENRLGRRGDEVLTDEQRKVNTDIMLGKIALEDAESTLRERAKDADIEVRKKIGLHKAASEFTIGKGKMDEFENEIESYFLQDQIKKVVSRGSFREKAGGAITGGMIENAVHTAEQIQKFLKEKGEEGQDILEEKGYVTSLDDVSQQQFEDYKRIKTAAAKQDDMVSMFTPEGKPLSGIEEAVMGIWDILKGGGRDIGGIGMAISELAE